MLGKVANVDSYQSRVSGLLNVRHVTIGYYDDSVSWLNVEFRR